MLQASLTENFAYDTRNFLTATSGSGFTTTSTSYDATGNISYKSNVGTYNYPGATSSHPHAPDSITGTVIGCANPGFSYDANGNMYSGLGRTYTYTSYNMPSRIVGSRTCGGTSYQYDYTYNSEHERTKLIHSTLGTFIYLHPGGAGTLFYEKEIQPGGLIVHRHYITAGGRTIGMYISRSNGVVNYRFFHGDQVNSVLLVTNGGGTLMESLAYESYGKRRNVNGSDDSSNTINPVQTHRGFTSHEHLDEIGLVHMNGRIYDPVIGKFITPDPFVQSPGDVASYNRYAYVNNNPLGYMDPSGYISIGGFKLSGDNIRMIASIAITAYLGYGDLTWLTGMSAGTVGITGNALGNAVLAGFAGGIVGTGTLSGGVHGAASAALFAAAGTFGLDNVISFERIGAHAVAGCLSAEMSGGNCGSGAMSAGFAKAATFYISESFGTVGKGVAVSMIGGTASVIGGGKFANGAQTAAYGYLFNQMSMSQDMPPSRGLQYGRVRSEFGLVDKIETRWVPYMEDGAEVRDANGRQVMTREDHWRGRDGNTYVIRDHQLGHAGRTGELGPHLNVLRVTETGEYSVGKSHYFYLPTHPHGNSVFRVGGEIRPSVNLLLERQIMMMRASGWQY